MRTAHERALAYVKDPAIDVAGTASARLAAIVSRCTAWHARHHVAARVCQYELAGLTPRALRRDRPDPPSDQRGSSATPIEQRASTEGILHPCRREPPGPRDARAGASISSAGTASTARTPPSSWATSTPGLALKMVSGKDAAG